MKISKETLKILSSFRNINESLVVEEGNRLCTTNPSRTIMAIANTTEEFPEFMLHGLTSFLNFIGLYNEPELEFSDKYLVITENKRITKLTYADASTINSALDTLFTAVDKLDSFNGYEIRFNLSDTDLAGLLKSASILGVNDITINKKSNNSLSIISALINNRNEIQSNYDVELDTESDLTNIDFNIIIPIAHLLILPGDYEILISSKNIIRFNNKTFDIHYYIAPDEKTDIKLL